jgi:hypothetical protein
MPSKEEVTVESMGAPQHRYGDQHLAVGHRRHSKKRTRGDGAPRKKFATARRRMTRRDIPARYKGRGNEGPTTERRRYWSNQCFMNKTKKKTEHRGFSPQANYADRATAACRRS